MDIVDNCIQLYRAIRPDEIEYIMQGGGLLPPCDCIGPQPQPSCCDLTPSQHVSAGSRAVEKSRYVSLTKDYSIAAAWSATKEGKPGTIYSGMLVKICVPVSFFENDRMIDLEKTEVGLGATARNFAMASKEVLIRDGISQEKAFSFEVWRSKLISKPEYDNTNQFAIRGGKIIKTKTMALRKRKEKVRHILLEKIYERR